jgi:spore coat protein U-like protein
MANTKAAKLLLCVLMGGVVVAGSARTLSAGSNTANLNVSASVVANCTISTLPIAFGAYDPVVTNATTNDDAAGSVIVACTKGTAATIGLGLGSNASGTTRRMKDATTDYLSYELYQETGRITVWGTTGTALLSIGAAPSKAARTFTVYGRIPSAQDVPAGSYSDTVQATVNF